MHCFYTVSTAVFYCILPCSSQPLPMIIKQQPPALQKGKFMSQTPSSYNQTLSRNSQELK